MRGVRIFWALAVFAFVVLGAAAVWLGGLNQDEGWYLYAANLVAEGKMPYRDFFFTQGPMLPYVYSAFAGLWQTGGLAMARVFTLVLGVLGVFVAMALARRFVVPEARNAASLVVLLLLGCNLYHLYYLAIPKTYALASLFVMLGLYLVKVAVDRRPVFALLAGIALGFAAGTRISLGAILPVVGLWLLCARRWRALVWFCFGGFGALALVYGPFLLDEKALHGLLAAQTYHAARGGFDLTWTVGSLSRLVRWYLPLFVVLGLGWGIKVKVEGEGEGDGGQWNGLYLLLFSFLAVFIAQILAPFPYEDYQVPIMGLIAVYAAVNFVRNVNTPPFTFTSHLHLLLALGLAFANSFGSPLLEKWATNGQDRFWSLKKDKYELPQLQEVAREIEAMDPGGKDLFTQDLYLAIETNRKVPTGLEMGPFAMLSDGEWKQLISSAPCRIAAMSGYAFAIEPPKCTERPIGKQMEYWGLLKRNYELVAKEDVFGQNATPLLILKRK